jgi:hypothetical protein
LRPKEFAHEYTKILYVAELLHGLAYLHAQNYMADVRNSPNDPSKWLWKTGIEFLDYLAGKFDMGL